ncbi:MULTISPECIES: hypothetical protein [unclassified Streptomyces]|uniref:hypothetical protein n=1 Tax=unclassified Streptomyces TaxID=2593676 RepID=UPI0033317AF7
MQEAALVHDQVVPGPEHEEDLPTDEFLGELPGGVGVCLAELGPLQHLGGESDEPLARLGAVQDRERIELGSAPVMDEARVL